MAGWSTKIRAVPAEATSRIDDPRLGDHIAPWNGDLDVLRPGQPVLIGFPQDEGVRRNGGRTGAASAPDEIRRYLRRLTAWDARLERDLSTLTPLDLGNLVVGADLEASQLLLGQVVAAVRTRLALPIILGGGHETAYGTYLGHIRSERQIRVINLDAHLDVRPTNDGLGHSGSPFRQMLEHPIRPLPGTNYHCLGAQPFSVSREHLGYLRQRNGQVVWCEELHGCLEERLFASCQGSGDGADIQLSIDADAIHVGDVPGVSSPNPAGLSGPEVLRAARKLGEWERIASVELVEINPRFDVDGRSARWAALLIWEFLSGLTKRVSPRR